MNAPHAGERGVGTARHVVLQSVDSSVFPGHFDPYRSEPS
ncbi:hypothetical protein BURMUCF1_A1556 [Burkholderia multivorans ATCC BAA-247]|uniref:Uncharacterized protein n=1 Tax=Burkholderia multivorans CGD2 TaxID=513052 RepID=B9BKJ3_9BURK|nr:hypothetical protein BURMUCGD2_5601 [Burkholderia multivorans CGD2]EEE16147.1 hypothetical protein BURMUCGD2M_5592 [Burkholderia multivorans CGD2M]EJO54441.1 hypothetical protein BURMUCF1_A1556 [Burkholderia multivorans ATCC BAA-247]